MGVLGFEEAFRSAILVTLRQEPRLDIPVSTLAGLAVMKLISWDDSYPGRGKDGEDFYYVAENYIDEVLALINSVREGFSDRLK